MHVDPVVPADTGLLGLSIVAGVLGVVADPSDLRHKLALGAVPAAADDVLRAAKLLRLKARLVRSGQVRLERIAFPALALLKDGGFCVLAGFQDGRVLLFDPIARTPSIEPLADFRERWSGSLLLVARRFDPTKLDAVFDFRWFFAAMRRYRGIFVEILVASFCLQIFGLVTPMFFQIVVDKVLVHRTLSTLEILVLGLVLVAIFECGLGALRTYVLSHTTNRLDVELGARLYDHLLALPMSYFGARRVGDSVSRVRELEHIREFLTGSALTIVLDLLFTVVFVAVLFWYSTALAWIVVASFPFFFLVSAVATPIFYRRLNEKFNLGAENQAFLVESVTGVETLKAMAVEPQMRRTWEEQLAAYVTASFDVVKLANVASQLIQLISKVCLAALLFFGAHEVIAGRLTVGELVAVNMLAGRVISPVLRLAQIWQDFHQTRISVRRLGDILNTPREVRQHGEPRATLPPISGDICFDRVSFKYRADGKNVLSDIDLSIPAGQVVGIVGASGSGKSTLAKLVQRLYLPSAGRVLVDGVDLQLVRDGPRSRMRPARRRAKPRRRMSPPGV